MSSHKHNFQCFNAIGGKGSHKPSPPFKHHTTHLPRIPQHGSMVHHDHTDECCLCSEYRDTQALEDEETQLSDFHQTHPSYHKYHQHQYVLRAPGRPEEAPVNQECHIYHHRHNKRVVLVKSSDPSIKKTIILHRRSLRSFSLFLEEISQLMHFNIRKLYTPDGQKIDSIQGLLQCPGLLVCVGREPSHPSLMENLQISTDKLPKLGVKSHYTDSTDGHKRLAGEKNVIPPEAESDNKGTKQSPEKPVPDSADSPDLVGSCPPTDNNIKDDDIKKRVRINKDGSLSMEMKVRFRLQNDETLHWSTKVKKTSGGTREFKQGHSNAYFAQVSERSFSESETVSADEAWVTRPYQRHAEEPRCLCSSHFQDYDIWENIPDTHGASRCVHSSSSSASSHTVVSRKTIVEMQSVSRSSEELTEQVIEKETCIKKVTQAAETVEYCTVCEKGEGASQRASRASQKSNSEVNVQKQASRSSGGSSKSNNTKLYQLCQCGVSAGHVNERNEQILNQAEEEECGILSSAMSVKSPASNTSESTENVACRDNQGRSSKSAMLCHSDASTKTTYDVLDVAAEGQQTADVKCTNERPPSTQSVKSIKGERSVKLEQLQEYLKREYDGKEERALSSVSSKVSTRSKGSRTSPVLSERLADEDLEQRTPSTMSAISNVSAELKHIACETSEEESSQSSAEEKDGDQNAQSRISEQGYFSPKSETSEAATMKNTQDDQAEKKENNRTQSAQSVASNSSAPLQKSTDFEATTVRTTSVISVKSNTSVKSADIEPHARVRADIPDDANSENTNQERPQSTQSTQSVMSVVSNKSTKSERSKTAQILEQKDVDAVENGDVGEPREVKKMPNNSEERIAGALFGSKVTPVQQSDIHGDNSQETLCDGEIERSLSSVSATSRRSNCSACTPANENTKISLDENGVNTEDRSLSRISVNSVQSHAQRAPSALSSKSAKSCSSIKSNKSNTETFGEKNAEEETQERAQSRVSVISTESREADPAAGKHMSEFKEHMERTPSNLSVRSEQSHISLTSQKTNVSDICLGNEDRIVDGEDEKRPLSGHSVVSDVSVGSNKSKCQNDDFRETPDKKTRESNEERPPSCKSSRSKQSCVSKISEERPQSALSAKSAKSVQSEVLSVENDTKAGAQDDADESQERAESVLSAKSAKSVISAKSHKSEERDVKENVSDSDHENRPPSILSIRSAKSTISKVSTTSKKSNVSETCLEGGVDSLDERNIKGGSGSETVRSVSVQSVDSSVSAKSKTAESRVDVPPDEESVTSKQSSKEEVNERPPSDMSGKSEESSISEMSINSVETANSARSSKSARSRGSTKSVKSKASENCSGKTPDERHNENLEGTNCQDCSTEKEACDDDLPVEKALSDLSGKSVTLNAATDVSEVCSEDEADDPDESIVEGGREGRLLSAQSFDSNTSANKSNCTTDAPVGSDIVSSEETFKEPEVERAASTVSTKSVQSNISGISGSHGKKTSSALSAKSTKSSASEKSEHSKDTEPQSGRASAVDTEDQERSGSVISVESNNSENSVQSDRPQCSDMESPTDCKEHADRAQTNLSVKSGKSVKSNSSTASKRSNVSENVNTDGDNIEQSEERASSCTSNKSVVSHVSERSRKSCAAGIHEDGAERTQSALSVKSVKSTTSTKSNETKGMDDSAKRYTPDEKENRTLGNMSERSKSIESNVSAVSKKSEVSVSCELNTEESTEKQHEEEDLGNKSVKSNTSARSSRSKCASDFPNIENSRPRSQGSAISVKSNLSGSSVHNTPEERNDEENHERAKSASSEKSRTSKKSKKSKVSASPAEGSASDSDDMERSASSLSVSSAKSAKSNLSEAKKSKASDATEATDAENEGRMSSLSTLTNRSNISARSKLSKASDTMASQNLESENNDCDEGKSCKSVKSDQSRVSKKSKKHEEFATDDLDVDEKQKTTERTPSTLSARSSKSLSSKSTQSGKSIKSRGLKYGDAPENHCASENTSVQSQRSMEAGLLEENAIEEKTEGAPSGVFPGSEDSFERGQSVMSVTSNCSRKSAKNCKLSAASSEEQTVEEVGRSPSNMSGSTNKTTNHVSSRNVTPHGELLEDCTNEEQRSPSIVSAKSSISTKSTQKSFSTKSNKSKVSDAQREERPDEQMNRALSKASMNSAKSNNSDDSNKVQGSEVSPDQNVHAVDENKVEDVSKRALSPISAKSNATSTTTKSNTSYDMKRSRNAEGLEPKHKQDDDVKKTPSVLSIESNTSSKTMHKKDMDNIRDGVQSTKSAKSHQSEVPAVTIEESEDRSPTTMSLKSKTSGRSKKSKSSESQKSERKTKGSLSVHSHLSAKSKRSTVTDVSAVTVTSSNPAEVVKVREISGSHLFDKKQFDEMSEPLEVKNQLIRQAESKDSDLSQTLSSSEVIKETDGVAAPPESTSVSEMDSSHRSKSKEADESELVPSILPNASPTEVVNEWLKTIPPESDIYEMEDLSENCEKISQAAEVGKEAEDSKKTDNASAETSKDTDKGGLIHPDLNDECKTGTETSNDNHGSPQTADASKMLNSSVQVMRVLLNPKPDRCNSLPEISPVYGRKLSTSATGLLDCLVKLQLIDHNPKNANEQDKKYQDLMHILQSLWLCDPSENEQKPTRNDNRFVEDEYNHTSSSGVDVNSGSTGSGKSSDGIKSSNSNHEDVPQPHNITVCKDSKGDAVWQSEREEEKLEEDNPETNDTIRHNDSPRETPETPASSNKSSGTSSTISQKVLQEAELKGEEDLDPGSPILSTRANLTKNMSQNPDPVWVLNLLTKIEKQFMVHYVSAMKEFKGRWNLADNNQLDEFINELKAEIERRIQKSINREVKKIQDSVGLPRPPNDTMSQESTAQAKERKQKLKKRLRHSVGSQEEKSGDSTTGTPYSDQRSENIDESCPCETCMKESTNSEASLQVEATNAEHSGNSRNGDEVKVAETLVENVVFAAVKEVEGEKEEQCTEEISPYEVDKTEDDCQSMESLTKDERQKKPDVAEGDSTDDDTLREEAETEDETPLEGESQDSEEDKSEEIKTERSAADDEDAIMEADAERAAEEESAKDGSQEEELVENKICVINQPKLLKEVSVASTAEEESNIIAAEETIAASSENESERDEVVEDTDEVEHESVKEAALEAGRVNDEEEDCGIDDFAEDLNSTTNDDDTTDDATNHGLSSEAAENATEDEVAVEKEFEVTREDEVCEVQTEVSAGGDETVNEANVCATSEHESVTGKHSKEGFQSDLEVVSSEDDVPNENRDLVTGNDLAKEPDDIMTTEDDTSEEQDSTGDEESKEDTAAEEESSSEVRASSDHESESEEPVKMEKVDAEEESSAASESKSAEDPDIGTSDAISDEDELADETAGSVSKDDSERDEDEEESSVVKKEKPLEISVDENRDTSTADESSEEEDAKMTNDDLAADKEEAATSQSESKDETDEDKIGTEEADKEEETELHTQEDTADDGNDTGVISEDHSTEDETPKESDASCKELSSEQPEKDLEKTEEEPATPETNSDYPGVTSGAENDSEEEEPDLLNNEDSTAISKEPDQEEITANRESEGENEEDLGETPVVDQVDITSEDVEEDTTSSQGDSADNEDASTKEETSAAEKETSGDEEINKVDNKLTETSNKEELDGCSVKDDPQSARTESSSDNGSKEESNNSGTDESRPGSTLTDPNDTTGQDESRVSNDSESPDDSEVQPKNQVVDKIMQEASDESDTSSRSEEQEKTESSDKPADSSANEILTEDKSEDDKSYSEEVKEREHEVLEEDSGDVMKHEITENDTKEESSEEDTRAGEETEVQTFITDESAVGKAFKEDTGIKHVQESESKDFNSCEKDKNMDDALDKEEETETANDDWSGDEGNSADEEDEAEEDSDEPEEHTRVELKPLVKATNQGQPDKQGKETLLMPLDTLKKEKDESEDGAYADVEDSETEINSQEQSEF